MWSESMVRSFLLLVKTKSFTKAAEDSYFTQQAISRHIKNLENELQCTLFIREHGGVTLTPAGERYYQAFQQAIQLIDDAQQDVTQLLRQQKAVVNIACLSMLPMADSWRDFLLAFKQVYPGITVNVASYNGSECWDKLETGQCDAVIAFYDEKEPIRQYDSLELRKPALEVLCIHKDYPGADKATSYKDFKGIPYIIPSYSAEYKLAELRRLGISGNRVIYADCVSDANNAVDMLAGGLIMPTKDITVQSNWLTFEIPAYSEGVSLIWKRGIISPPLDTMVRAMRKFQKEEEI